MKKASPVLIFIILVFVFTPPSLFSRENDFELDDAPELKTNVSPEERFHDLLIRENDKISIHDSSGEVEISLLSSETPVSRKVDNEDHYEIKIPIGSSAPVICYTAEKNSDVPHAYLKAFFDHMDQNNQIEKRGLKTLQANLLQDLPYIYMETEYMTVDKKYGRVKSLSFSIMGNSFFCFHDELGYSKTFLNVVSSLVQSDFVRVIKEKYSNYHEKQIDLIYLNGKAVGFFENYEFEGENHNRNFLTLSSMIMPRSSTDLVGIGTLTNVSVDKDTGEVQSEGHYSYMNGEANHELQLTRMEDRKYRVKGSFSGKDVDSTFETKEPLLSSSQVIKDFMKKNGDGVSFEEYSPISPLGPSSSRVVNKGSQEDGTMLLEYTIHSQTYNFNMDKNGYRSLLMSMGPMSMIIKRSYFDRKN